MESGVEGVEKVRQIVHRGRRLHEKLRIEYNVHDALWYDSLDEIG